jgi:putative DNA primase/helicase
VATVADIAPAADDILARERTIIERIHADPLLALGEIPVRALAPPPQTDRLPLAAVVDLSAIDGLGAEATPADMAAALGVVRLSLPPDLDALSRAEIRETIRTRQPQIPARMIDAAVAAPPRRTTATPSTAARETTPLSGTAVLLADPASWPQPVLGAQLLTDTAAAVRRYVVVTSEQATAISLWIGMAYLIDVIEIAPILLATAATPRAGKTTLCIVVGALTPRPILISSISAAVLYRLIEAHRPTLIGDEGDTWVTDERSDIRGVINAGHTRATATVARCVGDDHEVRLYSVWCARMLAMIGRPPSTILDRSIAIELRRRTDDEPIARLRQDRIADELRPLREQWRRWADDHAAATRTADPDVPAGLHDRAADCWRPLLAIADLVGADWPARARAAAIALSGEQTDEAIGTELLADIRTIYAERDAERMSSTDLTAALIAMADRPWAEWSRGRALTAARLARLLRPYGIVPVMYREGARVIRGYPRSMLTDAWTRYLSPSGAETPATPATRATSPASIGPDRPDRDLLHPTAVALQPTCVALHPTDVADHDREKSPASIGPCSDVAAVAGGSGDCDREGDHHGI